MLFDLQNMATDLLYEHFRLHSAEILLPCANAADSVINRVYVFDDSVSMSAILDPDAVALVIISGKECCRHFRENAMSQLFKSTVCILCDNLSVLEILNILLEVSPGSANILSKQFELHLLHFYIKTLQDGHHVRIRDLIQAISSVFQKKIKVENAGGENSSHETDSSILESVPQYARVIMTVSDHPIYFGRVPKADLGNSIIAPIYRFNDVVEFLIVGNYSNQLSPVEIAALNASIMALEVEYEMRRSVFSVVNNSRNNLMDSITISGRLPASTIYDWATLLGFKTNKLYAVIYLDFQSEYNTADTGRNVYYEILEFMIHYYHPDDYYFIRSSNDSLYMVGQYSLNSEPDVQGKAYAMTEQLLHSLRQKKMIRVIHAGIGSTQSDIDSISQSYRDAIEAVQMARTSNKPIISFRKLGILRLLNHLPENDSMESYIPAFITQLEQYDIKYNSNLIETISAYYAANCNAAQAAKALFIHYKTMLGRLNRIRQITNIDFNDSQNRLDAEVGLRILNMIQLPETP